MLPLASEKPGGPDMLLTASADGTLAVWDPSLTAVRGADREMSAKHSFKAHDSGVAVSAGVHDELRTVVGQVGRETGGFVQAGKPCGRHGTRLAVWEAVGRPTWSTRLAHPNSPLPNSVSIHACSFFAFAQPSGTC